MKRTERVTQRDTSRAIEANRQRKYHKWAHEMREHGWECEAPTPTEIEALLEAKRWAADQKEEQ